MKNKWIHRILFLLGFALVFVFFREQGWAQGGQSECEVSTKGMSKQQKKSQELACQKEQAKTALEIIEIEKKIREAQAVQVAQQSDQPLVLEAGSMSTDPRTIGIARDNKAVVTVTYRQTPDGNQWEGSKGWAEIRKLEIKSDADVRKEQAKASRPIVVVDGLGSFTTLNNNFVSPNGLSNAASDAACKLPNGDSNGRCPDIAGQNVVVQSGTQRRW